MGHDLNNMLYTGNYEYPVSNQIVFRHPAPPLASMERLWVPEQERVIIPSLIHKRYRPMDGFCPEMGKPAGLRPGLDPLRCLGLARAMDFVGKGITVPDA